MGSATLQRTGSPEHHAGPDLSGLADDAAGRSGRKRKTPAVKNASLRLRFKRDWQMLLLMVPGLLFLALFFYVPILGNVIAFQDYQPFLGIGNSDWVGWQNFVELSTTPISGPRCATPWCWLGGSWCCSSRCRSVWR